MQWVLPKRKFLEGTKNLRQERICSKNWEKWKVGKRTIILKVWELIKVYLKSLSAHNNHNNHLHLWNWPWRDTEPLLLFPHEHKFLTSRENLKVERAFFLHISKQDYRRAGNNSRTTSYPLPKALPAEGNTGCPNPKLEQLLYSFSDASVAVLATRVRLSYLRVEERRE